MPAPELAERINVLIKQLAKKTSAKSEGQFTATLPDSIPAQPKQFSANDVRMQRPNNTGFTVNAYHDKLPDTMWFNMIFPASIKTGTYKFSSAPGASSVMGSFTDWSETGDGILFYLAYSGEINVTHFSIPDQRMTAEFVWKTIGGRTFSGKFDISRFDED